MFRLVVGLRLGTSKFYLLSSIAYVILEIC